MPLNSALKRVVDRSSVLFVLSLEHAAILRIRQQRLGDRGLAACHRACPVLDVTGSSVGGTETIRGKCRRTVGVCIADCKIRANSGNRGIERIEHVNRAESRWQMRPLRSDVRYGGKEVAGQLTFNCQVPLR